eukprot:scaffold2256_cov371-Prasinococcus_capsulatus_cf.AAC.12
MLGQQSAVITLACCSCHCSPAEPGPGMSSGCVVPNFCFGVATGPQSKNDALAAHCVAICNGLKASSCAAQKGAVPAAPCRPAARRRGCVAAGALDGKGLGQAPSDATSRALHHHLHSPLPFPHRVPLPAALAASPQ